MDDSITVNNIQIISGLDQKSNYSSHPVTSTTAINPLPQPSLSSDVLTVGPLLPVSTQIQPPYFQPTNTYSNVFGYTTDSLSTIPTPIATTPVPLNTPFFHSFGQPVTVGTSFIFREDKKCSNCLETVSPTWRRHPVTGRSVCNACGLYFKLHRKDRTFVLNSRGRWVVKRHPKSKVQKKRVPAQFIMDHQQWVPEMFAPAQDVVKTEPAPEGTFIFKQYVPPTVQPEQ